MCRHLLVSVFTLLTLAGCSKRTDTSTPERDGGGSESDGGVTPVLENSCLGPASAALADARVPEGYCAWTWATGLDAPRGLAVASNGDVLVVEKGLGRITLLHDDDANGVSDVNERVPLSGGLSLNHSIVIHGAHLYASSASTVYRWPFTAGVRTALGPPQEVVTGIPTGGHSTRTLAFDAGGSLYVSVGSAGNVDADSSRARIRRFTPAQVQAGGAPFNSGEVFADGLRNEAGLAFDARNRLWGVENGRDNLIRDDLGGDIHQDNPAEELNLFAEAGRFYGYPYCWSEFLLPAGTGSGPGTQWADPTTMGDGTHDDAWCKSTANVVPPVLSMPAHVAPLDLTFYPGGSFPEDAVGDAFVSFHGSWNRSTPQGYEVARVIFENEAPVRYEPFLEYEGSAAQGGAWDHRPVGVRTGAHGELLVTSDATGVVLAVGYRR